MTVLNKAELVAHLRALGRGKALPRNEEQGLCLELCILLSGHNKALHRRVLGYMEEWPEFSGDSMYPVPHPSHSPFWGFNFSNECKMWHRGEYAKARKRLCLFLADKLEQEGNEV